MMDKKRKDAKDMRIIVIKKWADFADHRMLCIGWFFYHITIFCLVVINIVFFICHFKDYTFAPTDTSVLMLTIVGFLFAFAGINIYSIFNTNLEAEKNSLQKLEDEYQKKLAETLDTIEFSKSLVRIQVLSQLIVSSTKADYQLLDNIESTKQLFLRAKDYVCTHKGQVYYNQGGDPEIDIKILASGVKSQLMFLKERISRDIKGFYDRFPDEASVVEADMQLNELYKLMGRFEDGSIYNQTVDVSAEITQPTIMERVKMAIKAIGKIFRP